MEGDLRDAVKLGHVSKRHAKQSIISQEGFAKGDRGSTFSPEEMRAIRAYMTNDAWLNEFSQIKVREARYLLRAMTSLMASTGITPGLEVETLTPAQIVEVADSNGQPGLRITVRKAQGKRKNGRVVWARSHDVWPVLQDMRSCCLESWPTRRKCIGATNHMAIVCPAIGLIAVDESLRGICRRVGSSRIVLRSGIGRFRTSTVVVIINGYEPHLITHELQPISGAGRA